MDDEIVETIEESTEINWKENTAQNKFYNQVEETRIFQKKYVIM